MQKGKTESLGANAFSMLVETARNCQELPEVEEERNNMIQLTAYGIWKAIIVHWRVVILEYLPN